MHLAVPGFINIRRCVHSLTHTQMCMRANIPSLYFECCLISLISCTILSSNVYAERNVHTYSNMYIQCALYKLQFLNVDFFFGKLKCACKTRCCSMCTETIHWLQAKATKKEKRNYLVDGNFGFEGNWFDYKCH